MSDLSESLASLSISHDKPSSNDEWLEILRKINTTNDYSLAKVLVFKPKTPKTQTPVPIVIVALNETSTPSGQIAKLANVKDPRFASQDLITEFFSGKEATDIGPLDITKDNASTVKILIDSSINVKKVAIRFTDASHTAFVKGSKLIEYYKSINADLTIVDFSQQVEDKPVKAEKKIEKAPAPSGKIEGAALIGITVDKDIDFPGWYQQVLTKGEMLDYYDVSGCYILRPASYSIWERVQAFFDAKIKSIGVRNAYFPMFVSSRVLEREKDHIEGFAPEVAWVTKAGNTDLEEPIAIRPTSETVMYPYYAKWIRSHRDLPLRLNQWNSVVRWEFKHPQPFLRTREFLWQEGHTAHLTREGAEEEVMQILDWYAEVYERLLAVPVVKGKKTDAEKFAGSFFSTTVEGYIPTTGRGIQGGTSHCLGQNFSKMFNIVVENPDGQDKPKIHVWQNSWGLSTRVLGVMVMVHSDNKGLVIPPMVAETQLVVIPCGLTAKTTTEEREAVIAGAKNIESTLAGSDVRVLGDFRDNYSPGWKFSDWELRGVPLRIEFGPADMKKDQVVAVRRDNGVKTVIAIADLTTKIPELLKTIQGDMYARAKKSYDDHRVHVKSIDEIVPLLNKKCVILAPFCGEEDCEDDIKERTGKPAEGEEVDERAPSMGAKSLCIPFDQPQVDENAKCIGCGKKAKFITQFGRSY